ncbi:MULTISPECIES: 2-oxoacid:acceptor oxidoreductase subunit alpha [Chloracidobacterium]|jgi:2-oxoglutarate ferredoxin oxidoreductase subunit alpha|uniref:2-oxoacid:acceptor oxidoreductase subunit alpha n=1 Tax=Chloracidobacterium sp. N TaxID=2821540 RepID=A0ABX8B3K4_9BACT|nr:MULTISPECIES: 2-oxoacid:acceptor oxidoreductase subunit alpha [Chloracidobacterium]QUV85873.1 2-oxoacid:acceptor oxidoreductase subunit alpha [Chloracidobacterium sp. 2]QUV89706.1 2-oxoacid:acceptor oxidoreductase subunit alpha [Chloracidobacterium sp. S]QUV92302.1 2-oxoacid:acceptor oxidoreductase subunit alpha [Chloracidobacterium sp. A]QUV95577.1 2-oxoacid:acceptor oxidoreductase subunit alpha [Chloracidobacterium sp. N]QUV98800.1 2-oxoacid:acceptor oxidoreductase subunit alpha [Chloraci
MSSTAILGNTEEKIQEVTSVTVRFAGDSGDGMQLTGTQFTNTAALLGNDISTLPDFPAEIRAPQGSLPGVSGFQVNFSSMDIRTPGDEPDVLVAMNPAALKVNLPDLHEGGILIVNENEFIKSNLDKAGYTSNPLTDGSLKGYRLISIPITDLTYNALADMDMTKRNKERCKNFFALGIVFALFDRPLEPTYQWIEQKFGAKPEIAEANRRTLKAGYDYADTTEIFTTHYRVRKASLPPGKYRKITGNEATALGFVAASELTGRPLFYGSYPITPASDILHELSRLKNFGIKSFQAEDEIAAMGAAIGAAFAGHIGLTGTSGPGVCLKSEAIGLAVMTELPVVIINVQRGGPSTGLPTKTEQSDLLQALYGRNGECPVAVVAPSSPSDCFNMAVEAVRLAVTFMTPVFYLSDGYIANGAEPWKIPQLSELPPMKQVLRQDPTGFLPYERDEQTLARPWAVPGTPGLEHRIGGLEKQHRTGNVSYDPANHDFMVRLRAEKIARIANFIPDLAVEGDPEGDLLVLGWGGTYGAIATATEELRRQGYRVSNAHLRYLNPFPRNLGDVLKRFKRVAVAELNLGQLNLLIRGMFLVDSVSINKVAGKPFKISELITRCKALL